MANDITNLKADWRTALTNRLDAQTRTDFANFIINRYNAEWLDRLATGTADNATNRGIFVIDMIVQRLHVQFKQYKNELQIAALTPPTGLE